MIARSLISGVIIVVSTVMSSPALAECLRAIGAVPSLQGEAQVQAAGMWRQAALNEQLCPGDVIHVGERSRAEVTVVNQPNVRLDQNTALHLPGYDEPFIVKLLYGAAYFFSRYPRVLTVETPFIDAAVEGTEFLVQVEAERTLIVVFEGRVRASNPQGELAVTSGEAALAEAGRAPTPYLIVRPRDAVQWTLFYPAILPALADPSGASAQQLPEPLRGAVALAAAGQLPAAFAQFEAITDAERGSDYYLYRAAALLAVGRVEEARADLGQAALRDPGDGRADALSAVIAVAQNDRERALAEAQRAVELSPRSAAAKIALSYAEQARFQIEAARQAMNQAVEDEPENPLAWARLSELWLMQGRRERARRAAQKARELGPELARTQTVLGFADLAEINTARAKKAFRRAIAIDSANPLPRFGLGLATIRAGDLEGGRKEIEIAVALDPENALLRSYLGKAYFDERTTNPLIYFHELVENFPNQENTLAAQQFAISKELDPNDPTPWLYNAIRLQSENRPVEALRDLEKSIELNDNRAVYRSRELLDEDQAARGTSLARIYNDLGFEQLGINEATKSLSLDPGNAGAHRFLSDVYATQPRREIARVSELLQAQLLQDININPVQPSLSVTNLGIITSGGPARPGFNEFTPLFERNQAQLNATGILGNQNTFGDEAVVSGIYDNVSISAGQFHYRTDGFRRNAEIRNDVYNIFAQAAITPEFNVQAEGWRRTSKSGNIRLDFDPYPPLDARHRELHQDIGRLGAKWSIAPNSTFISSFIFSDRDETLGVGPSGRTEINDAASQFENQFLLQGDRINMTAGAGFYDIERRRHPPSGSSERESINQKSLYLYPVVRFPDNVRWTLGLTYDDYKEGALQQHKLNPKLGVQWDITDRVRLRSALFRTVKPALIANRTIEPTQVAGFNQFFDDFNGAEAWRYGAGLDVRLADTVYAGTEVVRRDLDSPYFLGRVARTADLDEGEFRTYLYWTPTAELGISGEIELTSFDHNETAFNPTQIETLAIPLAVQYFNPSGFFAGIVGTFARQDVNRPPPGQTATNEGSENLFLIDGAIGYRLPQRRGQISLEVRNVFDSNFSYQDDTFRTQGDESQVSRYIPRRTIFSRFTISF